MSEVLLQKPYFVYRYFGAFGSEIPGLGKRLPGPVIAPLLRTSSLGILVSLKFCSPCSELLGLSTAICGLGVEVRPPA